MVFNCLDHHRMLLGDAGDLHPSSVADSWVRHVAVSRDFIAGIDDDDALTGLIGEDPGDLSQLSRFPDSRPTEDQDGLARPDDIVDDVDGPFERASYPARQSDDFSVTISHARNPVQSALDPGSVVIAKIPDGLDNVFQVVLADEDVVESFNAVAVANLGKAPVVEHDFDQGIEVGCYLEAFSYHWRQDVEKLGEAVGKDGHEVGRFNVRVRHKSGTGVHPEKGRLDC